MDTSGRRYGEAGLRRSVTASWTIQKRYAGAVRRLDKIVLARMKSTPAPTVPGLIFPAGPAEKAAPFRGERNRLHLAKTLKSNANVLLLDEPSNDLDVNTLRALEDALLEFAGCVLVISHDRWFLDRIATHISL